ncbi:MAG: hypothetical protein AAFR93_09395 [Pseudomonadota bacterium]
MADALKAKANGLSRDGHEVYGRRQTLNKGVGIVLAATVLMIFAVTLVKLSAGIEMKGFDHTFETTPGAGER